MLTRLLVAVLFTVSAVLATPIVITNPSFESPVMGNGGYGATVTGWTLVGDGGVWDPTLTEYGATPDGVQVAYLNSGASLEQSLGAAPGWTTQYTLSGFIGNRLDGYDAAGTIEFLIGGTPIITLTQDPQAGAWIPVSSSVSSTSVGKMSIRLTTAGTQANFDNISLDAVTIPEPGSYALVGLGLAAVAFWRRRRKV